MNARPNSVEYLRIVTVSCHFSNLVSLTELTENVKVSVHVQLVAGLFVM